MAYRKGAIVIKKGKFSVVNLIMSKSTTGIDTYATSYGTYIHEKDAVGVCRRLNRVASCSQCPNSPSRKGNCAIR